MKIARFFAAVFGILGTILMVGTIGLCLFSLDAEVVLREVPQEAQSCVQEMMDALAAGDFTAASRNMYGQPDLGAGTRPEDEMGALVWDAFLDSISYEFTSECYADDSGIYRDATITVLDIPSVTSQWQGGVHTFLTADVQAAQDMAEIYDENNNFRADLVDKVILEAVEQSLKEPNWITENVTLKLVYRDDAWWVVPDEALLQVLTGGV